MAHTYNHIRTETDPSNRRHTLRSDLETVAHSRTLKVAGALGAVGASGFLAFNIVNGLTAENDEPRFEHAPNVTTVHLEEGARVRHSPAAENEPPIKTIDHATSIPTENGVYIKTEFRNGTWVGLNASDIEGLDSHFDDDGIVWVNQQKASTESTIDK